MDRFDIKTAGTGDIVAVAGFETIDVGDSHVIQLIQCLLTPCILKSLHYL